MNKTKVVHLTSAHPRYDIRIFLKMCSSLAKAGYDVSLVVADGKGYEENNNVKIYDVGKPLNRLSRMIKYSLLVYKRALLLNADIYHIHDPELLPYAYLLKKHGKKVIFDSHEDTPRQILSKPYLNDDLLKSISYIYEKYEKYTCGNLDYIITATPFIRDIFIKYNKNTVDINNFPLLSTQWLNLNKIWNVMTSSNLNKDEVVYKESSDKSNIINKICYVGAITKTRGCNEMIDSLQYLKNDIKLCLAGNFDKSVDLDKLKEKIGWEKVEYKGYLSPKEVKAMLQDSFAGIVIIHPMVNYIDSLPTKMFEYMSAGLPVIVSNFPLWKKIIEEDNKCGICVDPLKPKQVARVIDYLYEHPKEAMRMGINGKKAVFNKYNWENEEKKLLNIYDSLK